jgi:hypothetical protein
MNYTDHHLDPHGGYVTDGGRQVERNAARVLDLYPAANVERTRDAIQIDIRTDTDGERGVTVLVTPEAYELRLPTIEWTAGAYGPADSTRYITRAKAHRLTDEVLASLLQEAIARRDAEFVPCRYCGCPTPPEHRHRDACHGCAEQHLGVDH